MYDNEMGSSSVSAEQMNDYFDGLTDESATIHRLVFQRNKTQLLHELKSERNINTLEFKDNRGNTPLQIAVQLGYMDIARILLKHGASSDSENVNGWGCIEEAVNLPSVKLTALLLYYQQLNQYNKWKNVIPTVLTRLEEVKFLLLLDHQLNRFLLFINIIFFMLNDRCRIFMLK